MNDVEVLEAYNRLIKLTEASDNYKASPAEEKAIEIGLNQVKEGKVKYHGEVIKGFRQKLRNK